MAVYRIKKEYFKHELIASFDKLTDTLDYCEEVLNVDQIYDCLKEYDYDERVNEYIGKI